MSRSFRPQLTLLIGLIALAVVAALAYALGGSTAPAGRVVWIAGAGVTVAAMLTAWFAAGRVGRTLRAMNDHLSRREQDLLRANEQLQARVAEDTAKLTRVSGELDEADRRMHELAREDALTGLANRHSAEQLLDYQLAWHRRHQRPFGVLLCEVDDLAPINDQHDQAENELVLQAVALVLRNTVRDSDTPARFGDAIFFVLLPETDAEGAAIVAEKIRSAIAGLELEGVGRRTVSVGGAVTLVGRNRAAQMLRDAEEALHAARVGGRNRVVMAASLDAGPTLSPGYLSSTVPHALDEGPP